MAKSDTVIVHQANTCLLFTPNRPKIMLGNGVVWVAAPGLKNAVTIELPAGAFQDSTWQLAPGGSTPSGPAGKIGTYDYKRPVSCADDKTNGPGVDIGGGTTP